jgi:hypothetical protein
MKASMKREILGPPTGQVKVADLAGLGSTIARSTPSIEGRRAEDDRAPTRTRAHGHRPTSAERTTLGPAPLRDRGPTEEDRITDCV